MWKSDIYKTFNSNRVVSIALFLNPTVVRHANTESMSLDDTHCKKNEDNKRAFTN